MEKFVNRYKTLKIERTRDLFEKLILSAPKEVN